MYRKKLWKRTVAGTLALMMTLAPVMTSSTVLAAEAEAMTEMEAVIEADVLTEPDTEVTGMEEPLEASEEPEVNAAAGDIKLNTANFPDANFRSYLFTNVDSNHDNILSKTERSACTYMDVSRLNIKNMKGIEHFTNLSTLVCEENQLTSLDVSKNTKLTELNCAKNQLTGLDVSKNTKLIYFFCNENQITSLDVSKNTNLVEFYCNNNYLKTLDVTKNTKLVKLECYTNALTKLDVTKNIELEKLDCCNNSLTSLNVTKNTKLTELYCEINRLTELDVTKNTEVYALYCHENELASLNVSKNSKLIYLHCRDNQLTALDVSENPELYDLLCDRNYLSVLDVSKNPDLVYLECKENELTTLDLSQNTSLTGVACSGNQLACLNISTDGEISEDSLECTDNVHYIELDDERKFDLSTISGFDTSKVSDVTGGSISENNLTFDSEAEAVSYSYDCVNGIKKTFTLQALKTITKITLNKTSASVLKGKTLQLSAETMPIDASKQSFTWTSSNEKVATVNATGKVTAVGGGTATITCTAKDGSGVKATCKITVKIPVTKVKLNQTSAALSPKETLQLKATVTPSNASNKAVTWKSSNTKVATVSSSGKVTAKKAGTVTITCTAKDGSGKKATCKITVYTNTEAFVARIYTKALSRTAEEAGLKYWTEEINSGRKTPVEVAESFFFAPEFTNKNLSNTEYVKVLYRTFMGREYDEAGLNYWVARLNKGESRKSVLESFAGCQEFKDIVKSFGL